MNTVYQRGTLWELKTNAHFVPRGVYTLVGHFDEVLVFEVGPHIQFTLVERFYRAFLEKAKASGIRPTSEGEFIPRYSALLTRSGKALSGVEGMSFVFMHPRLAKRLTTDAIWA